MALWTDPYYRFPSIENKVSKKPVTVDVTGSAGNFKGEIPGLADLTTDFRARGIGVPHPDPRSTICDFGAGKLRNTLYLLQARFAVCAVEHELTFQRPQGKARLRAARRFEHFTLISPRAFRECMDKYPAILLTNVVNVIPDIDDRREVIAACADHLRKDGLLVWMTQFGEPHYRRGAATRMRVSDGYCYNLGREYQTFVKEFTIPEIRKIVPHSKFRELRQLNVQYHHAFLFARR